MIGTLLGHTQVQTAARYAPSPMIPSKPQPERFPDFIAIGGDEACPRWQPPLVCAHFFD